MNNVSIFNNDEFGEIRLVLDPSGNIWFVAIDVARSLGYSNPKDAIKRHVDEEDTIVLELTDNQWGVNQYLLKTRYLDKVRIINESGLYALVLSSKLESARKFKKWVTSEVLPSIRKNGSYSALPKDYVSALEALIVEVKAKEKALAEKDQIESEKDQAIKTIENQRPDVEFSQSYIDLEGEFIMEVAKRMENFKYIIAAKTLFYLLNEIGFIYKGSDNRWRIYESARNKGYMKYGKIKDHDIYEDNPKTPKITNEGFKKILSLMDNRRSLFERYGKFVI